MEVIGWGKRNKYGDKEYTIYVIFRDKGDIGVLVCIVQFYIIYEFIEIRIFRNNKIGEMQ